MSFNTTTYESYMHALKKGLESFDSALADEIIHDFESHFADARSQGLSDEEICAELGDVNDVLTFFRQEYATTEQPVARTEAKTSNAEGHLSTSTSTGSASQSSSALPDINAQLSQEPQYSYPSDPAASITRMEIVLRNASASFAPGTSACVSFDCTRELDPDRFEVGIDGNTFYLREKKISAAVFWKHFFYTGQKTEKFIFQVPSTVQQITLRSVNGGTELSHLSLEKLDRIRLPFAGNQWKTGSYRHTGRQSRGFRHKRKTAGICQLLPRCFKRSQRHRPVRRNMQRIPAGQIGQWIGKTVSSTWSVRCRCFCIDGNRKDSSHGKRKYFFFFQALYPEK